MFKIYDKPESLIANGGGVFKTYDGNNIAKGWCLRYMTEPEPRSKGACVRCMMELISPMGWCSRYMTNRNRPVRVRV